MEQNKTAKNERVGVKRTGELTVDLDHVHTSWKNGSGRLTTF